jgi:hypothetical protein
VSDCATEVNLILFLQNDADLSLNSGYLLKHRGCWQSLRFLARRFQINAAPVQTSNHITKYLISYLFRGPQNSGKYKIDPAKTK